ncbi:GmrSD restriction endonuclease domain-containing protein [Agrobacterium tumefaciens]|uniref:GmrSD restriction endonuclease domain-containing protein n=1 Tax=Agrobacterium tumefaciens TaxID=358 RepID=UPI003B9F544D
MASPAQKIFEADSESLYDFVSKNGRGLYIPPYQRDYAWDKANVERLIDDTVQGLGALLRRPDESITFIGTIIAMNDAKKLTISPLVKNQVYSQVMTIIDGQQRLTTLLMLCLALLIEIETEWASLTKAKIIVSDETRSWIETRVNDMRGLLSQMLSEEQRNGEGEFRHFPKMIRAFKDTWSYEAEKASYLSPIAWMLFEYVKFSRQDNPNWAKFLTELQRTSLGAENEAERKHFVKMMKVMRTKLKALPSDDEFPDFATIVHDVEKQDALFGEEFPAAMTEALSQILAKQSHGLMVDEAGDLDLEADDKKTKEWWQSATSLISLLFFSRFALERITLVVVTATTEDFAFDVFEALNTTGQPLTALETFTPKVVQSIGLQHYNASEEKKQLDAAFSYLKKATNAEARQKRSAELLVAFALAERGEKQSKNLADQRRFMRDTFDGCGNSKDQKSFVQHLADLARFFDEVWVDGVPAVGSTKLPKDSALCIRFLVALGHTITAPLLAQYAAAISAAGQDVELRKLAMEEFATVAKAVTAFAVLWRSSRSTTDRIEQVYRDLMSKGSPEHGVGPLARGLRERGVLPKASVIQQVLAARLRADRTNGGANISSKEEWIEKTILQPIYFVNVALARFVLMAAFHDTVEGPNGLLVEGKPNSHPTLTIDAWTAETYMSVEHVAPQSGGHWAQDLYGDDEYDRLGNLTLVPLSANQSLSARAWDHKRKFFAALAADTKQEAEIILAELKGMGADVSKVAGRIHGEQYLPHVKALASYPDDWNLHAVDRRGRLLAELAWNRLAPWVGM